ncbi:UNVERIFIED_CONTAM: hypothetical protein HDU68_006296, partial [Siphonaria sp. JEL0065]
MQAQRLHLAFLITGFIAVQVCHSVPLPSSSTTTPAQLLNLGHNWYIQLPVGNTPESTTYGSVFPPNLDTFSSPNFGLSDSELAQGFAATNPGVTFYTPNTGITTGGSESPRTELRHMCDAAGPTSRSYGGWASNDTYPHQLNVTLQVDWVPLNKLVIVAQLFSVSGGAQFTYRVGSKNGKYYFSLCTKNGCFTFDNYYTLATAFTLNINAFNNQLTTIYRNLASGTTFSNSVFMSPYPDYVFKAGNYCHIVA